MTNQKNITQRYAAYLKNIYSETADNALEKLTKVPASQNYVEPCFYRMQTLKPAKPGDRVVHRIGSNVEACIKQSKRCQQSDSELTHLAQCFNGYENMSFKITVCMPCALKFITEADSFIEKSFDGNQHSHPEAKMFDIVTTKGNTIPKALNASGIQFTHVDSWCVDRLALDGLGLSSLEAMLNVALANESKGGVISSYFDYNIPYKFNNLSENAQFVASFDKTTLPMICYEDVLEDYTLYLFRCADTIQAYLSFSRIDQWSEYDTSIKKNRQ